MIIDPAELAIFIPAALALNLTPGNDTLFCLGQGLKSGPRAGIGASLGIATGSMIHSLLAAFGLATLLATHPLAFEAIRWAGIAYLLWLAVQSVRHPARLQEPGETTQSTAWRAWREGIVVNLLNPKVAIFILAFIPQFVDPTRGSTILQFLMFGMIFNLGGTIITLLVGGFSGSIGRVLTTNERIADIYRWATAGIFFGLAAKLAFERR